MVAIDQLERTDNLRSRGNRIRFDEDGMEQERAFSSSSSPRLCSAGPRQRRQATNKASSTKINGHTRPKSRPTNRQKSYLPPAIAPSAQVNVIAPAVDTTYKAAKIAIIKRLSASGYTEAIISKTRKAGTRVTQNRLAPS